MESISNEPAIDRQAYWLISRLACLFVAVLALASPANAAPQCPHLTCFPRPTLTAQYAAAEVTLLARWVSTIEATAPTPERTLFRVVAVGKDFSDSFAAGDQMSVELSFPPRSSGLYFLSGHRESSAGTKWICSPSAINEVAFRYILAAPSPDVAPQERLRYYAKFLVDRDPVISNDAFAEFFDAPPSELASVADALPREDLRRWLTDLETRAARRSAIGLMLGLCGECQDIELLERLILYRDPEDGIGLDGYMTGYLLLAGDEGLAQIESSFLGNPAASDGECCAAVCALRHCWRYGNARISKERLKEAMRLGLDRPTLADSAIRDLARWKDWSLHDRLMQLYDTPGFNEKCTRKSIICYMISSARAVPPGSEENLPKHAVEGAARLKELRESDPALVSKCERFFPY